MSSFLRKTILFGSCYVRTLPHTTVPDFLRNPDSFCPRLFSSSSNRQSFTVSYLINSLELSPQSALSASKYINFDSPEKPDKVINLFKNYGFTQFQISTLVRIAPKLLIFDAEKNVLPKLEFLESKGISVPEMAKILSVFPSLLKASLANRIMPSYDFFRNFFRSDQKAILAVKRCPDILVNVEKYVAPNISILREHGVADSNIARMLQNWPKYLVTSPCVLRKVVEKVEGMEFDASKVNFVLAVLAFQSMSKSTWDNKVDLYKKWGWSEEDVLNAFKRNPWCMMHSKDKLMECMDFFINQMSWTPCLLAKCPIIFGLSLKKRVVPRCSVFQVLLSKGLVEKEFSPLSLLIVPENKFLQRFVLPYNEEVPELLKLYKEKLDLSKSPETADKA